MPDFGIIDAHVHLWDTRRLSYGWLQGKEQLNRPYLPEDFRSACGPVDVAGLVFVECDVDRAQTDAEVEFIQEQAHVDPRIKAIVAQARLEGGTTVMADLERLKRSTPLLRGVRRITEFEPDLDFCLRPAFIDGARLLRELDLSLDLCVNYRHLDHLLQFVDRVGDIRIMLDHCCKPAIREGRMEPWHSQMRALASHPNVMCKISGLPGEADHQNWSEAQIRPYIDAVVESFGFDRIVYGGDWPACLPANGIPEWVALLDRAFSGVSRSNLTRFYRGNAIAFYRLDLGE